MFISKRLFRVVSIILISAMLGSCIHYIPFETKKDPLPSLEGRVLRLIPEGQPSGERYLVNATVQDSMLTGGLLSVWDKPYEKKSQLVNIYLDKSVALPDTVPVQFTFPVSGIKKIEVYDLDLGALIFSTIVIAGVTYVVAMAIIIIIILLTKGTSCPFIYVNTGGDFVFTGEIYSGAVFPDLERDDYLALPEIQPVKGEYQLKIANKVKEIQNTNLAELCVVDHPKGTAVLADRTGKYWTVRDPQKPVEAHSYLQSDLLSFVSGKDSLKFVGDDTTDKTRDKDALFVSFARPENADSAKLVLRAKNSFWLDYTFKQFFAKFGDKYDKWYAKQSKVSASDKKEFAREQGIPLSVYMKQNGEWKFLDYFNVVGPMAERDLVMPLDVSALDTDKIELKLECGALFWEIDYAALDFSPAQQTWQTIVSPSTATDQNGRDVRAALTRSDKKYYSQPNPGDEALLTYAVPAVREGCDRTVFLHSRGHYKVLIDTQGSPDLAFLEPFRQAERFGQFSRENYLELKEKLNR